jgi:phosphoribosylanthranilate isomerase
VWSIWTTLRRCGVSTLQLVDRVAPGAHAALRSALPGIQLVQVIHVGGDDSVAEARTVAPEVDALLLDSGNQALPVKVLGGTGRTHDWSVSRRIVEAVPVPVYLAGGLTVVNVGEAVRQVRPFGVDVCSGVRSGGRLNEARLAAFAAAVRASDHGADCY